jgi:hypothetical protein
MLAIEKVALPADALIVQALPDVDYADAYRVQLPQGRRYDVADLSRMVFARAPRWISALMRLRDALVRPLGLKTAAQLSGRPVDPATHIGFFRIYARAADEVVLGEDDRHLDFRVSIRCRRENDRSRVTVSTVVHYNSWLGRLYFVPVRLGHRIIVPALMRHIVRQL